MPASSSVNGWNSDNFLPPHHFFALSISVEMGLEEAGGEAEALEPESVE